MTTLAELIVQAPDDAHGFEIQIPASSGVWKFALQLADPLAGVDVVWYDLTQFYASDRYERGAAEYMGRYRASVAQVHLIIDNVQADDLGVSVDILAPWGFDTTALFGEDVTLDAGLLMRAVIFRVASGSTVEHHPLWTGRVETWGDAASARGQIRDHLVIVSDLIGDLVNVPTEAATSNWDIWIESQVLAQANWPFGIDIYGDTGSPDLPDRTEVQSAINEMDAACDPLGLAWRSLRSGRLVVHPAPWDSTHTDRYDNPILDVYPGGPIFSYNPDFTEIEYITDDDSEPPGVTRTSLGVINTINIAMPGGPYPIDSPTSQSKYGMRPYSATWIIDNEPAADQILTYRQDASQQALPLRTTIDHDGFFPAMAMLDHLDPVALVHSTHETGSVVTASGSVRSITEVREMRHASALSWESTVQIDVTTLVRSEALLPVEDLAVSGITDISADFSWTNPTQPDVTPTEIQYRLIEVSSIWVSMGYGGVGSDGVSLFSLDSETAYTFQVRLVRRVNGLITHASAVRTVEFITLALEEPTPVPDDDDTDVDVPPVDDECEIELELQENDGTGWVTVDSWEQDDLVLGEDGLYHLETPIPNSFFEEDKIYRFRYREVCGGTPGDWVNGPSFDPPADWEDPCVTPPSLANDPYSSPDLLVYVPQICAPDIVAEAVSGIHGFHGAGYGGLVQMVGDPDYLGLESNASGGVIAYGECNTPPVGSKTIGARVNLSEAAFVTLFECGAMRLTCTPDGGSNWKAGATVFTADGTGTCLSSSLDFDTTYLLRAEYDATTGDLTLYVDGVEDGDTTFGEARDTIAALPTWFVGAPPT